MRAIRSAGNASTERRLTNLLARRAFSGWRLHEDALPGNPDFYFAAARLAVFIDGCFWHGCPRCGHIPKTNVAYWRNKILRNKKRDAFITRKLRSLGFSVLRFRECQLKRTPDKCVNRLMRTVRARR